MTDNEIIKALECCAQLQQRCDECPDRHELNLCGLALKSQALKLINRQKAEIERLEYYIENLRCINTDLKDCLACLSNEVETARADAVKEFAERLKTKVDIDLCAAIDCSDYLTDDLPKIIDNLVKEFTEGGDTE